MTIVNRTMPAQTFYQWEGLDQSPYINMSSTNQAQERQAGIPGIDGAPNEKALLELMNRTGFSMIQENGQRKFGGPPPHWTGPAPPRGCEIFVGKIPRDCYEDELVPIFEKIGRIYELRLMMDFSGTNRGYCFVMFTNREDAKKAVGQMNNYELRKGRFLGVCLSVDNCRLFVGGIPKNKEKHEIYQEMKKVTEGVVDVIVYPSPADKTKNRGFAFVEYESHRAAAMARRKLIPGRIQLFGHQIAVDWAEPEAEVDEDIMSKVKVLYVRNLMLATTEETLRGICEQGAGKDSCVERCKKIRDYAFVHFTDRNDAVRVMKQLNGTKIEGSLVEVTLAKPVDKNDHIRYTRGAGRTVGPLAQAALTYGYDLAYTGAPATYLPTQYSTAAGIVPQVNTAPQVTTQLSPTRVYAAPARTGAGVSPVPRGVNSGPLRGRGRGAAGIRGTGGRTYLAGRSNYRKHPAEVLDEFCMKSSWGSPIYQLHSTISKDGQTGDTVQLFLFKVSIPALAHNSQFTPNKLCRTVDEAKQFAAEYVLMQLNVPMETGGAGDASTVLAYPATTLYSPAVPPAPTATQAGRLITAPPQPQYNLSTVQATSTLAANPTTIPAPATQTPRNPQASDYLLAASLQTPGTASYMMCNPASTIAAKMATTYIQPTLSVPPPCIMPTPENVAAVTAVPPPTCDMMGYDPAASFHHFPYAAYHQ